MNISKNVAVRLLGTRFTDAISCFEAGPQGSLHDMCRASLLQKEWENGFFCRAMRVQIGPSFSFISLQKTMRII
jgi:hypothetical protein